MREGKALARQGGYDGSSEPLQLIDAISNKFLCADPFSETNNCLPCACSDLIVTSIDPCQTDPFGSEFYCGKRYCRPNNYFKYFGYNIFSLPYSNQLNNPIL